MTRLTALAAITAVAALVTADADAQAPSAPTMKQLMVDLIHPASNGILLAIHRPAPDDDARWAMLRRDAITLAESGTLLAGRGRPADTAWAEDARRLLDIGTGLYRAAMARDVAALASFAEPLDDSCTTCHRHFRPTMFAPEARAK